MRHPLSTRRPTRSTCRSANTAYEPYRNQSVMILTTSKEGREVVDGTELFDSKGRLKPER